MYGRYLGGAQGRIVCVGLLASACAARDGASSDAEGAFTIIDTPQTIVMGCTATPPAPPATSLPIPKWAATFDNQLSADITVEVGAGATNGGTYLDGRRGGKSYLPKGTYLKVPAANVINPTSGSIAVWLGNESFNSISNSPLVVYDTDNVLNKNGIATGFSVSLSRRYGNSQHKLRANFTYGSPDATTIQVPPSSFVDAPIQEWGAGQWHHVAVTWTTQTIRIYVDGLLASEAAGTYVPTTIPANANLYLMSNKRAGSAQLSNAGFRIDNMNSYAVELTPDQVARIYSDDVTTGITPKSVNDCLALELAGAPDGYGIRRVYDASNGSLKTSGAPSRKLWQLKLRSLDGKEIYVDNTATLKSLPTLATNATTLANTITWKIPLPNTSGVYENDVATVTYTIAPTDGNALGAKLSATMLTTSPWAVVEARVLRLDGLNSMGAPASATALVYPDRSTGRSIPNPFAVANPWQLPSQSLYPSREMAMQWFGISTNSNTQKGLFVAAYDPTASIKAFRLMPRNVNATSRLIDAEIALFAENAGKPGNGFQMTWPSVMSLQGGNWYDHARRYRKFATTAPWTPSPIVNQVTSPPWMKSAGLINSGAGPAVSNSLAGGLKAKNAPDGLVLFHYAQWDVVNQATDSQINDTPFLTPRPDFTTNLASAANANVKTALYFDPAVFDVASDATPASSPWKSQNGESMALRRQDGSVVMSNPTVAYNANVVGPAEHPSYMCPASVAWQDLVTEKMGELVTKYSFQGFYLDQVAALAPTLCYATNHGHPVGGGHHWVDGFRTIVAKLRAKFKPGQGAYTEGFAEPYLGVFDGFLVWDTAAEYSVPLAQAVYHSHTQFLGQFVELAQVDNVMTNTLPSAAKQAEALTWGNLPGYVLTPLDASATATFRDYLFSLARARRAFVNYLVDGDMQAPISVMLRSDTATLSSPTLGPKVTAAALPMQALDTVDMDHHPGVWRGPVVLHSTWKGSNGKALILLASSEWTATTRVVQVEIPASLGFGPTTKVSATTVTDLKETTTSLGTAATFPAYVRVEVPARGIVALELSP